MTAEPFISISHDALLGKSKAYVAKALARKEQEDLEEYQLWASLALELLGKAALATKHPCLIVDPTHSPSLFVAAGIPSTTDVKTITAKTLYERLQHAIERFDETVAAFCFAISQRRNAELHSGELPFKTMKIEAWEAQYWRACDVILDWMDITLTEWLGADEAVVPETIVREAIAATKAAAVLRIEAHRLNFSRLKKAEQERRLEEAAGKEIYHYGRIKLFRVSTDFEWKAACPACTGSGFVAGDLIFETVTEGDYGNDFWESVERTYSAEEFRCPVCDLNLVGQTEIEAGNLPVAHDEIEERQLEYEPEYGND